MCWLNARRLTTSCAQTQGGLEPRSLLLLMLTHCLDVQDQKRLLMAAAVDLHLRLLLALLVMLRLLLYRLPVQLL
jgi:hypothetical protein